MVLAFHCDKKMIIILIRNFLSQNFLLRFKSILGVLMANEWYEFHVPSMGERQLFHKQENGEEENLRKLPLSA